MRDADRSVVSCVAYFTGDLIDRLSLATTLAAALVIFIGQLIVSQWWLRDFAYGPVEWILRAIMIGRVPRLSHQPLKVSCS
ncbi:DUF418 domain-containing protein [Methylorubrum sp. POS3]|uniref:DUF418 domain-containing protein n=1 Tax=Methylorubrum sp. POS3 TaxID=2998492 RepID=UPI00372BE917